MPRPVVHRTAAVVHPVGGGQFVAWTEGSSSRARRTAVFARAAGGRAWKVSRGRMPARTGGIDASTLVYSQGTTVRFYDLARRRPRPVPLIRTGVLESNPTLSGGRLLYTRVNVRGRYHVVLRDLRTRHERTIAVIGGHATAAESGQVAGRYAVWWLCVEVACDVYRYNLTTRRNVQLSRGSATGPSYAPSVTANGTAYFARSGQGCGQSVQIVRAVRGTGPRAVYSFPPGKDVQSTYAVHSGRTTRLYFDRVDCRSGRSAAFVLSLSR